MWKWQPEGGFTVTSPLLPELITEGDTVEDALANVRDALKAVIELYEESGRELPPNVLISDVTALGLGCLTLLRVLVLIALASLIWVPIGVWLGLQRREMRVKVRLLAGVQGFRRAAVLRFQSPLVLSLFTLGFRVSDRFRHALKRRLLFRFAAEHLATRRPRMASAAEF